MAGADKSEKPTQRRLDKARGEGNFPASRDALSAVQLAVFAALAAAGSGWLLDNLISAARECLTWAFRREVSPGALSGLGAALAARFLPRLGMAGLGCAAATVAVQLGITGFGLAGSKLRPDLSRLDPSSRLKQMWGQGWGQLPQAALLVPAILWIAWSVAGSQIGLFLTLPFQPLRSGLAAAASSFSGILNQVTLLVAVWGAIDLFRKRRQWTNQLKMSKQEIRDESKESDGDPRTKSRIRRMQRALSRKKAMAAVDSATAVVVNPTHFAVALRYAPGEGGAPRVVAKGRNYLALRIRERAIRAGVPIVENPPLAQALYRSASVGQEIPAEFYKAVAEVLAYILRAMGGRLPGAAGVA